MSEPTKGPWRAIVAANEQPSLLYAGIVTTLFYSPDSYVAVVADAPLGMGEQSLLEECQANAYLISAAPLLRDALISLAANEYGEPCWCPLEWNDRHHMVECIAAKRALAAAAPAEGATGR